MLETKDDSSCPLCKQNEQIKSLLFYDWSSVGKEILKTLQLLLISYLGSDHCDESDPNSRKEIAFHVRVLHETIEHLQTLEVTAKS